MAVSIIWQQDGSDPNNGHNLDLVSQWWESLETQEIIWQQRLIPDSGQTQDISWDSQRFDEKFPLKSPQIRGITLYWQRIGETDERSITPKKLEFNADEKYLNIYPQSQPKLMIRISQLPEYKTLELDDPLMVGKALGDRYVVLVRDKQRKLELKINLSAEKMRQFLENLPSI